MGFKTKIAEMAQRLTGAQRAISELNGEDRRLREEHTAATEERRRLVEDLRPIDEAIAVMERAVDEHAALAREKDALGLILTFGNPRVPPAFGLWWVQPRSLLDLIALAPEWAKANLAAEMRTAIYEAGAASADRPRLLAEVSERLTSLEQQHKQLVTFAREQEPPIGFEYLPTVKKRRDDEEEQRRKDAAPAEVRRQETTAANAWHAARRGPTPSGYLSSPPRSSRWT